MPVLQLETDFPLKNYLVEVSENDQMFDISEHYVKVGLSALKLIDYAIDNGLTRPSGPQSILDLGCGHGRVTRALRSRFPHVELTVCDVDRDGVDFCANKFNAVGVYGTIDFDTMELGKLFDLILVGSVISHFGPEQTVSFIRCMTRHLAPDGLLILTSHGKVAVRHAIVTKMRSGVAYLLGKKKRKPLAKVISNAVEQYRSVSNINSQYHSTGYGFQADPSYRDQKYGNSIIARPWFEGFFAGEAYGIVAYLERGWDDLQDVLFVRRKESKKTERDVELAHAVE